MSPEPSRSGFTHDGYTLAKAKRVCGVCGGPVTLSGANARGVFFDTFNLDADGDWRAYHSSCARRRREVAAA